MRTLGVLVVLAIYWHGCVPLLRPGAIVEKVADVKHTSDHLIVYLNYGMFTNLPQQLKTLSKVTSDIINQLDFEKLNDTQESIVSSDLEQVFIQLQKFAKSILDEVEQCSSLFDIFFPNTQRQKRGLFNNVGRVSKVLFGTATMDDVDRLRQSIMKLSAGSAKVYRKLSNTINNHGQVLREVERSLSNTRRLLNQFIVGDLTTMHVLTSLLNVKYQVKTLHSQLREHITSLLSSTHTVSIELVQPAELTEIIEHGIKYHSLIPLFKPESYSSYYHITRIFYLPNQVVLVLPYTTITTSYELFHIIPFPTFHDDSIITWNGSETFFLYSNHTMLQAIVQLSNLESCFILESTYICDSAIFFFLSSKVSCLTQFLTSHTYDLSLCGSIKVPANTSDSSFSLRDRVHITVLGLYITVVNTRVQVNCDGDMSTKYYNATMFTPRHCTLVLPDEGARFMGVHDWTTKLDIHHVEPFVYIYPLNSSKMAIEEPSTVIVDIDLESEIIENSVLGEYMSAWENIPVISNIGVTLFLVVAVLVLGFCLWKRGNGCAQPKVIIEPQVVVAPQSSQVIQEPSSGRAKVVHRAAP